MKKIHNEINSLKNKHIKDLGIILNISNIIRIDKGKIDHDTGIVNFMARLEISLYTPKIGDTFEGKIHNISENGFFVSHPIYPIDIFVLMKNSKSMKKCKIKITKITFNKKYLIIGSCVN